MIIRQSKPSDEKELYELIKQNKDLQLNNQPIYSRKQLHLFLTNKDSVVVISEIDNVIMGFLFADVDTKNSVSLIQGLFISKSHRKKGIATQLKKEYEKILIKIKKIATIVSTKNKAVQKINEKLNYKKDKEKYYHYTKKLK